MWHSWEVYLCSWLSLFRFQLPCSHFQQELCTRVPLLKNLFWVAGDSSLRGKWESNECNVCVINIYNTLVLWCCQNIAVQWGLFARCRRTCRIITQTHTLGTTFSPSWILENFIRIWRKDCCCCKILVTKVSHPPMRKSTSWECCKSWKVLQVQAMQELKCAIKWMKKPSWTDSSRTPTIHTNRQSGNTISFASHIV